MRALFVLALVPIFPRDDEAARVRRWVEQLRSDGIEERDEAARRLRALGKAAVPELEKAAKNLELAAHLLKVIALAGEIPDLARRFPGVEERLVAGGPRAWTELFLKLWGREKDGDPTLDDLVAGERTLVVRRAFAGIRDEEDGGKIIGAVRSYRIKEAVPELSKVLAAKDDGWHNLALATLGEIGDASAAPLLIAGLKEPMAQVRGTAVDGLFRIGGKESVEALLAATKDPSSGVRYRATNVLAWRNAKEAVPAFVARLADEEPQVRVAALGALDRFGAVESVRDILPLLRDANEPVRIQAAATLCSLGSRDGAEIFLEKKKDATEYELSHRFDNVRFSGTFHPPGFEVLNGVRQPEAWRRLKETRFGCGAFSGTNREALERAAGQAGLAIQIPDAAGSREWLSGGFSGWYDWMPDNLLFVFVKARSGGLRLVLDSDRIRFIAPEEEAEFWAAWWKGEKEKK